MRRSLQHRAVREADVVLDLLRGRELGRLTPDRPDGSILAGVALRRGADRQFER